MNQYVYMSIPVRAISACIMEQYELEPLVQSGHVLVEIREGIFGLPKTGKLLIDRLVKDLSLSGLRTRKTNSRYLHPYYPSRCPHVSVDDFGIQCTRCENVNTSPAPLSHSTSSPPDCPAPVTSFPCWIRTTKRAPSICPCPAGIHQNSSTSLPTVSNKPRTPVRDRSMVSDSTNVARRRLHSTTARGPRQTPDTLVLPSSPRLHSPHYPFTLESAQTQGT
jgi:hypothetical protein